MPRFRSLLCLAAVAWFARSTPASPAVKQAAALYHQGLYDSALIQLEACLANAPLKHRDSLSVYQYLGMASARLGKGGEAETSFRALLDLDSLFQFPRNEDVTVLEAFARAKLERPAPAPVPAPAPAPTPAAAMVSFADSGTGDASPSPVASPTSVGAPPFRPDAPIPAEPRPRKIGLALGAVPLGGGWLARNRLGQGYALAFLQAGGIALSWYASDRISSHRHDPYGIKDDEELAIVQRWQWVQGVSLSTAVGAYLYSLIASTGE